MPEDESKDVETGRGFLLEQPSQPSAGDYAKQTLSSLANVFRPSFIPGRSPRTSSGGGNGNGGGSAPVGQQPNAPARARRNLWLDGLRGFASVMVYCLHHQLWAHAAKKNASEKIFESGWGYDGQYYLAQFHFIRTFFSGGHYAVTVFFVLSGYVLSMKPLRLIRAGDQAGMADAVASSIFRRWLRLFLPIIGVTLSIVLLYHIFGIKADFVPEKTLWAELWRWYLEFKNFSFPWREGGDPWFRYNFPTWSIPVEYRGSIAVYTTILAVSRMSVLARLLSELAFIFYFLYIADGAHFAMFTAGMFLCDFDMLAERDELPAFFNKLPTPSQTVLHMLLVLSVYLGGVPNYGSKLEKLQETPGWYFLSLLKPQAVFDYKWFFLFWSAVILVFVTPRIPWLRDFFEIKFNQYTGRLCYGFYLIHGPVMWTIGDRLYAAVGLVTDKQEKTIPNWISVLPLPSLGPYGLEMNFIICQMILFPLTCWLAEVTTAVFDEPSLRFTGWLYNKTFRSGDTVPR